MTNSPIYTITIKWPVESDVRPLIQDAGKTDRPDYDKLVRTLNWHRCLSSGEYGGAHMGYKLVPKRKKSPNLVPLKKKIESDHHFRVEIIFPETVEELYGQSRKGRINLRFLRLEYPNSYLAVSGERYLRNEHGLDGYMVESKRKFDRGTTLTLVEPELPDLLDFSKWTNLNPNRGRFCPMRPWL